MDDEEEEEQRTERLVVRIVPKFIDYAIFLIQLGILGSYFYVAYIFPKLGTVTCIADINSDTPIAKASQNIGVDVSSEF